MPAANTPETSVGGKGTPSGVKEVLVPSALKYVLYNPLPTILFALIRIVYEVPFVSPVIRYEVFAPLTSKVTPPETSIPPKGGFLHFGSSH